MRLAYLVELLPPQQPSVYQHPVGVVVNFLLIKESEMSYAHKRRKKLIKRGEWKFKPQQKGN